MEIQILSSEIICRVESQKKRRIQVTIFDKLSSDFHIAVLFAFKTPTPTNHALKEGLKKTLALYNTLTTQLQYDQNRRICALIEGSNGGAFVVETKVKAPLSHYLPFKPSPDFLHFHPSTETTEHMIQVQLNRFECDGLIIGVTAHHIVADGQSMSNFFLAWAKSVREVDIEPLPYYDKSLIAPRNPPTCEFQHWGVEFKSDVINPSLAYHTQSNSSKILNILVHYSNDFINTNLKARLSEKFTTFEVLLGHLWRKITYARELEEDIVTRVRVAVNGRRRLKPPLPMEYFGNLVLNAYPKTTVKTLLKGGLTDAAKLIRQEVRKLDDSYFKSFIDFGEINKDKELVPMSEGEGNILCPLLEVDSWLSFRFHELKFDAGNGVLCGFLPTWVPVGGVIILLPSLDGDGVDAMITMFEEHARNFKKISHCLN